MRRSFALRAAIGAALVMLAASALGAAWLGRLAEASLREQVDLALAAEAEALVREFNTLGLAGLAEQAAAYARRRGPVLVLLQSPDGAAIAGRLPAGSPPQLRGYATLTREADGARLRALGALLPSGANLVVATELGRVERAAARLAWAPAVVALAASVVALALGFLAARRLERRLEGASRAARAIMDGDLGRRLPESPAGDEFDRLAATMNLLLSRIEALVSTQRQVTDDIAHDLRTPLARLRQLLETAQAAPRDPVRDAETIEAATADLDAVLATFAALLRIARIESGAARAGFGPVDLSALVADIAEAYRPVVEEAGRRLDAMVEPEILREGEAGLLRQAVVNLLHNAIVHGAGPITLRLEPGPRIAVEDDGPGIPVAEREAVTRRFYRLDASRHTPGTGLGLSLVAATARLHDGCLRLEDRPARSRTAPSAAEDATAEAAREDRLPGLRAVLDLAPGGSPERS